MNILADRETQLSDKLNQFLHSPARSGLGIRAITIPIRLRMIHYHDTSSSSSHAGQQGPELRKKILSKGSEKYFFVFALTVSFCLC